MVRPVAKRTPVQTQSLTDRLIRRRLACHGTVQGVGFRPTIYRLACGMGLSGMVRNDSEGVTIEVEGSEPAVARFQERLASELPPLARLAAVAVRELAPLRAPGFVVQGSTSGPRARVLVPPDTAVCAACRAEVEDPGDRRYRYPFTTCTHCGPRFTLVHSFPYDRATTSMAPFELCEACRAEYEDPASRRFHTETVCCPDCGPRLWLSGADGREPAEGQRALERARAWLAAGDILAVKGLGGFQIACRADRPAGVDRLRRLKRRRAKPFALMVRGMDAARRLVHLRAEDEALLLGAHAPILLAPRRKGAAVAAAVAPGLDELGVMLPTTPLHVELFRDAPYDALVMTSGNLSDEPICRENEEALRRLSGLCDGFLLHDREVVRRVDDSVARAMPAGAALVRRSRGWVPEPIELPVSSPEAVLALGGYLQTTACFGLGARAFPSQHVGDLDSESAREFMLEVVRGLEDFLDTRARTFAVDLHPDYPSTWAGERVAAARGGRLVRVQHHLAHAAAVLAEHGRFPAEGERAAAICLDGTGLGTDGVAWGSEWLVIDGELGWRRVAHGSPLALVGGEQAVRQPWRVACAALARRNEVALLSRSPVASTIDPELLVQVARLSGRFEWPLATGAGRLFEAAGALLGVCCENEYEGEAAARLESLAHASDDSHRPWPELELARSTRELPSDQLLVAAARRVLEGESRASVAAGFHSTFCHLAAELTARVLPRGVRTVALGGGCMVNRLLARGLTRELEQRGFEALLPSALPAGDGGLSYGQAVVAAVGLARDRLPHQLQGA